MHFKQLAKLTWVLTICMVFTCGVAAAEKKISVKQKRSTPVNAQQEVIVRVRAIKASNPNTTNQEETKALFIDKRLNDISTKLSGFEFKTFKLISEQELTVPIKKKTAVDLTERTLLILRPLYSEDKKVGMWIKWTDNSGERTLLDTRMHFESPDTMLAGTNCKDNKALILAISAVPK